MKTFLVTSAVQFLVPCEDNGKLADKIYDELGYNVKTYVKLVVEELQNNFVGTFYEPTIEEIKP